MIKVSVIIPTWNREKLLLRAVKSALKQTGVEIEVLVCDDGSTDDSRKKVLALKDKRVCWIAGSHSGLPAVPRNRGLGRASGDWIAFLDSDDYWLSGKLKAQLNLAKKLNCQAVCTNAYQKGINKGLYLSLSKNKIFFGDLLRENLVICSSMIVHRSVIKSVGEIPQNSFFRAIEDYVFWLRVASKTSIAYLKKPYVVYTDNPRESVRRRGISNLRIQRWLVMANFLCWRLKEDF